MRSIKTAIATMFFLSLTSLVSAPVRAAGDPTKSQESSSTAQQDQSPPPKPTPPPRTPRQTPKSPVPESRRSEKQQTLPKEKSEKQQQKKENEQSKQEQKQQRQTTGTKARIPDDQLKAHFGQPHRFAAKQVITTTRIVPNQTRFVYFGYTFIFVDPWPIDWLLTDDCYIDYIDDQYFLFDAFHPGVRIALIIAG